jgi:PAS domain S-box-containing protein
MINKSPKTADLNKSNKNELPEKTAFTLNIAEMRESQKALSESEEKFRAIFEQNPIGIIMVRDSDLIIINSNNSFENMIGYSREELKKISIADISLHDEMKKELKLIRRLISNKRENYKIEKRFITKSGKIIWVEIISSLVKNTNSEPLYLLSLIDNITEKRIAENALKLSEERFRNLAENSQDIIYRFNITSFKFEYVSPAVERITGFRAENFYKNPSLYLQFMVPEDKIFLDKLDLKNINNPVTLKFFKKNGDLIWLEGFNSFLYNKEGKLSAVQGVIRDITERKLAEILQSGLNNVFEYLVTGQDLKYVLDSLIYTVEKQGKGYNCSIFLLDEQTNHFDTVAAPNLPEDFVNMVPELDLSKLNSPSSLAMSKKQLVIIEDIHKHELFEGVSGFLKTYDFFSSWCMPIIISNQAAVGTVNFYWNKIKQPSNAELRLLEVTAHIAGIAIELKSTEKRLLKAKDAAEIANQTKTEFLANMSHEIRTPLNAILGFAEILRADNINQSKYHDYLDGIEVGGRSLLNLINDILDLSKIEAGRMDINYEPVDIRQICAEVRKIFQIKINEKHLEFIQEIQKDIPEGLYLDEIRIRQILFNLVGNAVKFTQNGSIKITVQFDRKSESTGNLKILIADSGVGIPNDELIQIFEPFKQRDGQSARKYGGTGLGLTITKRLLDLMNGVISVKSEIDVGSSFELFFDNVKIAFDKNENIIAEPVKNEVYRIEVSDNINDFIEPEIMKIIKKKFYERWLLLSKTLVIDKIKDFALELNLFSKKNNLENLQEYSESLLLEIDSFNIENIIKILPVFGKFFI